MSRVKTGAVRRRRHNRLRKLASGYRGGRSSQFRTARNTVERALAYAYSGRKQRKRQFRQLWIARIGAAARALDISYSQLMNGLNKAGVEIDRKMLAELAVNQPEAFSALVERAKSA